MRCKLICFALSILCLGFHLESVQFFVLSDQKHLYDPEEISSHTQLIVDGKASFSLDPLFSPKTQRVLLLVHGYNDTPEEALSDYHFAFSHIEPMQDSTGAPLYDKIIGYLWPGCDDFWEYYAAEDNARNLSKRMHNFLLTLSLSSDIVDVMVFSMGNQLIFNALKTSFGALMKKPIRNFYSLAPAVDRNAIEKHHPYYHAAQQCENLFIFHSEHDDVLKFLYPLAEGDAALGSEGISSWSDAPSHLHWLDCSAFVSSHAAFFTSSPLYSFIHKQQLAPLASSEFSPIVKILLDGSFEEQRQ